MLRLEDTDQAREVSGAREDILESLRWLGLQWEEGPDVGGPHAPYVQSQRRNLYDRAAAQLLEQGSAYRCFCTPERLAKMRAQQQQQKLPPRYDRHCRSLSSTEQQQLLEKKIPFVLRCAVPEEGSVEIKDAIHGDVQFLFSDIDDFVIVKSDGFPTYHFANVIDDHDMEITHVIRGEEWLPSTPKHVVLYQALGWTPPVFAHLSVFLSPHGGKMSKREGATAVTAYRAAGYLPEALVNFMALLGWNPKTTEEFFTLTELVERFALQSVNVANPVFDITKLNWMQKHYLRLLSLADGRRRLQELIPRATKEDGVTITAFLDFLTSATEEQQQRWWRWFTERSTTLRDIAHAVTIREAPTYAPSLLIWKKSDAPTTTATRKILQELETFLATIAPEDFRSEVLEQRLLSWIATTTWGNGDVLWPLRVALSGQEKSPPPFELAEILGKEETARRLHHAQKILNEEIGNAIKA